MESSLFSKPRDLFIDIVDPKDYVQIDSVSHMYQSLKNSVQKPLKMILLYRITSYNVCYTKLLRETLSI